MRLEQEDPTKNGNNSSNARRDAYSELARIRIASATVAN